MSFDDLIGRAQAAQVPPKLRDYRKGVAPAIGELRHAIKACATPEEAVWRSRLHGHAEWIRDPRLDEISAVRRLVWEARQLYAEGADDGRAAAERAADYAEGLRWEDVQSFHIDSLIFARVDALRQAMGGLRSAKPYVERLDVLRAQVENNLKWTAANAPSTGNPQRGARPAPEPPRPAWQVGADRAAVNPAAVNERRA